MNNTASASDWFNTQEKTLGKAPCQNCGKMVTIILPFIGCIFCGDCKVSDSGSNDGTEDFYEPRRNISQEEHELLLNEGLNQYSDLWAQLAKR